jgi:hypothetical protein
MWLRQPERETVTSGAGAGHKLQREKNIMDVFVNGWPLIAVIMALVEWFKKVNVPASALPFVSMGIGVAAGVLYQYSQSPLLSFADWFGAAVSGVVYGLVASGLYDVSVTAKDRF